MELDTKYEEPLLFYGGLLVKHWMWEESLEAAVREVQTATQLDPNNTQPWVMLSQVYFRMGDQSARVGKETALGSRRENPAVLEGAQRGPFPYSERRPRQDHFRRTLLLAAGHT